MNKSGSSNNISNNGNEIDYDYNKSLSYACYNINNTNNKIYGEDAINRIINTISIMLINDQNDKKRTKDSFSHNIINRKINANSKILNQD